MTINANHTGSDIRPSYRTILEFVNGGGGHGKDLLENYMRARQRVNSPEGAAELADLCDRLESILGDLSSLAWKYKGENIVEFALASSCDHLDLERLEREFRALGAVCYGPWARAA